MASNTVILESKTKRYSNNPSSRRSCILNCYANSTENDYLSVTSDRSSTDGDDQLQESEETGITNTHTACTEGARTTKFKWTPPSAETVETRVEGFVVSFYNYKLSHCTQFNVSTLLKYLMTSVIESNQDIQKFVVRQNEGHPQHCNVE